MGQSTIVILNSEERQHVGVQLKAILDREGSYRVDLFGGVVSEPSDLAETLPRLVIAVLPVSKTGAHRRLTELRSVLDPIPLLPVVSPEALRKGFSDHLVCAEDFLVTPIREAEVC